MNKNWRNRPTVIDYIQKDIDYIVSIDESGNASLRQVLKAKRSGTKVHENEKHFTVTACLIKMCDFEKARDMVMELKNKYWKDALYTYNGELKRVCFHSREIRSRQEAFSPSIIDYTSFVVDLSTLMRDVPMTVYASHIDKIRHVNQYIHPDSPYDLCMTFVLERILRDIGPNKKCVIILEARGPKEDAELLGFIKGLIDHGSRYHQADRFKGIVGVYFNPKWCEMAGDKMSYWELELADLCAYPFYKHFAYGKQDKAFDVLVPKLSNYPYHLGKGLKSFP